jgi:ADP-ribose pyrophosphatase
MAEWPRITGRRVTELSPWVDVVERKVEFTAGSAAESFHALSQADYVAIIALTPTGQIPLVRQFRPAIERFTWELPAGLVDPDELPADTAKRELLEETGYPALTVTALGTTAPCTARFSNWMHSFYVETGERETNFRLEPGMEVRLAHPQELPGLIASGEFISQHHIGALFQASLQSRLRFS